MYKWVGGLLEKLFTVTGAFLLSQMPAFIRQYDLLLQGHASELRLQIRALSQLAASLGYTLIDYVDYLLRNKDSLVATQGQFTTALMARQADYEAAFQALQSANALNRPWIFLQHLKTDLFVETLQNFEPGLQLNAEQGMYILTGMAFGWGIYKTLIWAMTQLAALPRSGKITKLMPTKP